MSCEHVVPHLGSLLDDELPAEVKAEVEAHLPSCAACRLERDELASLRSTLQGLPLPVASPDLNARILAARRSAAGDGLRWLALARRGLAAAAAVVVILLGGMLQHAGAESPSAAELGAGRPAPVLHFNDVARQDVWDRCERELLPDDAPVRKVDKKQGWDRPYPMKGTKTV